MCQQEFSTSTSTSAMFVGSVVINHSKQCLVFPLLHVVSLVPVLLVYYALEECMHPEAYLSMDMHKTFV